MSKISVIVPIFNTEQYLVECLNSIVNQTLKDIEIILVDDGSTDSSSQICDEFASRDNRIKVIHKINEGLGKAYNTGILSASGEYIGIVEADDFAELNMFESLYRIAALSEADVVKSAWFCYSTKENARSKNCHLACYNSYEAFNIKDCPWLLDTQASIWSAIYKRTFLIEKNIFFLETPGASYQDVSFTYKALSLANNIVVTPDAYLHYRIDNENASVKSKDKVDVIFNEYKEVNRFIENNKDLKPFIDTYKLIRQYKDYLWNFHRVNICHKEYFINKFSEEFNQYKNNNELNELFFSNINKEECYQIINSPLSYLMDSINQ